MRSFLLSAAVAVVLAGVRASPGRRRWGLVDERDLPSHPAKRGLPAYNTTYWFDQLIDHNNPSLGTFKQRFFFSAEFYEPGGPILLQNAGEGNADGSWEYFLPDKNIQGRLAEATSGASIVMEHRFFGQSNPYPDLSEESLQFLTVQQNIDDMVYLAQNLVLPMKGGAHVTPDKAPWILIGGSYPGAVVNWAIYQYPEIFYAGYASSAVVQAIENFWQYFDPIRVNMPTNCSNDVQAVIAHVDAVFDSGDEVAINDVKEVFGMGNVTYVGDVASALSKPLFSWQNLDPYDASPYFYAFCDALEVKNNHSAPASGWGLDHALSAWGDYMKSVYYKGIIVDDETLGSDIGSLGKYTDTSVDQWARSWDWLVCNELGWFQVGAPEGYPTIVSRHLDLAHEKRLRCQYPFPKTFGEGGSPKVEQINAKFGGWDVHVDRVFFANGINDPWLDATVSSSFIDFETSPLTPVFLGDGFHCSDMSIPNGAVDPTIAHIQKQAVLYMQVWLAEWRQQNGWTL